jgi:hypothetical protein
MRKVNVSSVRTYRQIGGARNQPTEEEIDHVQDQETTGAASEDRPDEQGENVVQQPEGDDEDHAEGEEARQEKMTQIRDHWSGTN